MLITNFASGELSDKLSGRVDLPQYFQGAGYIENFEIQPTGGAFRRRGFQRIKSLSTTPCRLIPFIVDKYKSFLLCFEGGTTGGKLTIYPQNSQDTFTPVKIRKCTYYTRQDKTGIKRKVKDANGDVEKNADGTDKEEDIMKTVYIEKYTTEQEKATAKVVDEAHKVENVDAREEQDYLDTDYKLFSDIEEMQYAQNYDIIIFVHKSHRPIALKYHYSTDTFQYSPLYFDFTPDVNLSDPYADDEKDPFKEEKYIVAYGRLLHKENDTSAHKDVDDENLTITSVQDSRATGYKESEIFNAEGFYPSAIAFFNSRLWLAGSSNEPQRIYASRPLNTKRTEYNDFSTYEKNIVVEKKTSNPELMTFTGDISTSNKSTIQNVSRDFTKDQNFLSEVAAGKWYVYNEAIIPIGTKVESVTKTQIGMSQDCNDVFEKQTIVVEGTKDSAPATQTTDIDFTAKVFTLTKWRDPTTAQAEDYDFSVVSQNVVLADSSFSFEIASESNEAIKWLASGDTLLVGTESGLWQIPPETTALNIRATNPTRNGSDDIQALRIDNATVFFAQGKKGIREYYRGEQSQAFTTNNLSLLAEQMLTESAAKDFDYTSNPNYKLIITREDGKIACLLYDKNSGILGWTRIIHGNYNKSANTGLFTSCAVLRGSDESDILYQAVKDKDVYYLERYDPSKDVYLDSWQEVTAATVSSKAESYTADAVVVINHADGTQDVKTKDDATAPNGLTLSAGDKAYIGYNYTSKIESLPIVAGDPSGKKRIINLLVRFNKSYFPIMKCDGKEEYFLDADEPFSGYKYIDYPQNTERDVNFTLDFEKPLPCNILCIQANLA